MNMEMTFCLGKGLLVYLAAGVSFCRWQGRVEAEYDRKCAENKDMSWNHCTALLLQLEEDSDIDPEEAYMKPGGYKRFKADLKKIVQLYKNVPAKGVKVTPS